MLVKCSVFPTGLTSVRPPTRLLRLAVVAALSSAAATAVYAQNTPAAAPAAAPAVEEVQEVTVTGSRIVRRDFNSDSPVGTVSSDILKSTAEVGIAQQLKKPPHFR